MHKAGDVSINVDAAMAVSHLIGLEEHLAATVAIFNDPHMIGTIHHVRATRKCMLEFLVGAQPPGELWCASKHVLGAWMRIKEVGDKLTSYDGDDSKAAAIEMYQMAASMERVLKEIMLAIQQYQNNAMRCEVCIE
jgi:hypothetical protein